ncbi:MAG: hypothetical protein C4329_11055 [Chitinophagaceae bacterium]
MQQVIKIGLVATTVALLTVPSAFAQKKNVKEKTDAGIQQIIITRKGDPSTKTTIEVDGDKVKVNGKEVTDSKDGDITVHVNKFKTFKNLASVYAPGGRNWIYNFNDNNGASFFSVDSNRAMLGVVTDADDKGAKVSTITKNSSAEKAGLKKGDVITRIDGKKVEDAEDVSEIVRAHKPGDKISITYLRDGKEEKATAELGCWEGIRMNNIRINNMNLPKEWMNIDTYRKLIAPITPIPPGLEDNGFVFNTGRPKLGLSIQDTNDGVGAKVLEVESDSNAGKAGIQKDDVIVGIDDHEIRGTDDVTKIIRSNRDKSSFMFRVMRGGKTQNIEVKIPKKLKTADL